jgi:hypothetical protein
LCKRWIRSPTLAGCAWAAAIALGVGMVYFSILSPENPGFDTLWYHLPIAEQFAAQGAIRPFAEGWYYGAYPQLASIVYAWAFLLPHARLFDAVCLAAHLEFFVFLWTLLGTAALAEQLIVRGRAGAPRHLGMGLAVTFLFPSVFLYDGGLFTGADHMLAFFAVPWLLSWLRLSEGPTAGRAVLFGLLLGALVVTKYQAAWLIPLPLIVLAVALARKRALGPLAVAAGVALACAAPHWLKNWIAYGDPVYPLGAAWFHPRPWSRSAARLVDAVFARGFWPARGPLPEKLQETARALFTFSFEPHDWPTYHGQVPVFGSMFTLLLVALPFFHARRRLYWVIAFVLAGIAGWYWVSHQDRYLQALLPWMAASVAAIMIHLWRQGTAVRAGLSGLAIAQLAWGSGVYFIHARDDHYEIDRPSPLSAAVELLASGYEGTLEQKLSPFEPWPSIGRALPEGAKPLIHERHLRLGLGAPSVTDLPGSQGAISYEDLLWPEAIWRRLTALGVTHVVWETKASHANDTWASDFAFFRFVEAAVIERHAVGPFTVGRMIQPDDVSLASPVSDSVLLVDCAAHERSGELTLEQMARPNEPWDSDALPEPKSVDDLDAAWERAGFALVRSADQKCASPRADRGWVEAARRGGDALWVRLAARAQTAGAGTGAGR